ncbi:MAG: hypothetical protein L0K86_22165 [Actinomycetia bacterium]|nr:hypothetical protein [Actinomycetes bacterium]
MSDPEGARVVRQLRHDVDDVYELLSEVAEVQRTHGGELGEIRQAIRLQGDRLDRVDGRLEGIEDTQRQILELLRDDRSGR